MGDAEPDIDIGIDAEFETVTAWLPSSVVEARNFHASAN